MILHELLRDVFAETPGISDDAAARQVLAGLKVNAKATEVLADVVAQQAEWLHRRVTVPIERAVSKRRVTGADPVDVIAARRALLEESFPLGDGRWVKWGDATIPEHEQRIGFLMRMRDGLTLTIAGHEDAIERIKEAGVTCLREIEEAA